MVAEVIRETPDTATLVLFTGNDRMEYQAGQFLTIRPQQFPALERFCRYFEDMKGKKEPGRAYSLSSAPHEKQLAFTVKEERYVSGLTPYPPLLSPFLTWRVLPGTRMVVTGFGGPYVLPPDVESRTDHIVHICAGSGIVPNFSILKHCLATGMKLRHTLIYGNKTWDDVIFRRQLEALARQHPDKLRIVHALSREDRPAGAAGDIRRGRVSEELIRELIPDPTAIEVYTCGPGLTQVRAPGRRGARARSPSRASWRPPSKRCKHRRAHGAGPPRELRVGFSRGSRGRPPGPRPGRGCRRSAPPRRPCAGRRGCSCRGRGCRRRPAAPRRRRRRGPSWSAAPGTRSARRGSGGSWLAGGPTTSMTAGPAWKIAPRASSAVPALELRQGQGLAIEFQRALEVLRADHHPKLPDLHRVPLLGCKGRPARPATERRTTLGQTVSKGGAARGGRRRRISVVSSPA